jgi:hypothetical protein
MSHRDHGGDDLGGLKIPRFHDEGIGGRGVEFAAYFDTLASYASRCPSRKAMSSLTSGISRPAASTAIAQAAYAVAVRAATELLTSGTYNSVAGGIAYDTMNATIAHDAGLPAPAVRTDEP